MKRNFPTKEELRRICQLSGLHPEIKMDNHDKTQYKFLTYHFYWVESYLDKVNQDKLDTLEFLLTVTYDIKSLQYGGSDGHIFFALDKPGQDFLLPHKKTRAIF